MRKWEVSTVWLRDVALDWAAILLSLACVSYVSVWVAPLAVFVIGNRMHALALLGHDATHKLVAKPVWLNDWLGCLLCFSPAALPYDAYRRFHMQHHRFLSTDRDPEHPRKEAAGITAPTNNWRIAWRFLVDLCGLGVMDFRHMTLTRSTSGDWVSLAGFVAVLAMAGAAFGWTGLMCYLLAIPTSLLAITRLRISYEHLGTEGTHKIKPSWWSALLFLPHNAAYHHEHHEHPAVPYHRLPTIAETDRKPVQAIHN